MSTPKVTLNRAPIGTFMDNPSNENVNVNVNNDINVDVSVYKKKEKFEDSYTRQTFYIRNDLVTKINELATEKGLKTKVINDALDLFFKKHKK